MPSLNNTRPRARDIGIEIGTFPTGTLNAITDVPGVRVGHVSLRSDKGPIHTGVTAILPHEGNLYTEKVCAATHVINGFGKSIGFPQIAELGNIETPILLTNTLNVWIVADALIDYMAARNPEARTFNPVVGECNDGYLNDIVGRHVRKEHVMQALQSAERENFEEGCIGAGVGVHAFGWKGGIGTASRILSHNSGHHTLGVMVLTNTGQSSELRIDGVPFGREVIPDYLKTRSDSDGSIMIIIGTDAPLSSRQLTRIAKRAVFGLARTGAKAEHGSGDFVIAFSNGCRISSEGIPSTSGPLIPEPQLSDFFKITIEATEEAILNAILKAQTTTGRDGHLLTAIPIDRVESAMRKYNRR